MCYCVTRPIAMMITGLVKDETISSLDDFAHTYVPWWDKTGDKGQVTLRQLLSFTSGFGEGTPGNENATSTCMDNATNYPGVTFDSCAQMIYKNTSLHGTPGKTFSYNSVHLQLAGAVATHAANMTIQQVVSKYLLDPYVTNSPHPLRFLLSRVEGGSAHPIECHLELVACHFMLTCGCTFR